MNSNQRNALLQRLNDSKSLIDVLIQMENFLDSLDIYVFKNWFDGEIVDGPNISRYWVSMTLKYDFDSMPDSEGALRLMKHGAKVYYNKDTEEIAVPLNSPSDYEAGTKKPKMKKNKIWLVEIHIPRRFIEELDDSDLELYADEVEVDNVSDARDQGIDSSSDLKGHINNNESDAAENMSDNSDTNETAIDANNEDFTL